MNLEARLPISPPLVEPGDVILSYDLHLFYYGEAVEAVVTVAAVVISTSPLADQSILGFITIARPVWFILDEETAAYLEDTAS